MFSIIKTVAFNNGKSLVEAVCTSEDEKPTRFLNGSCCMEMDTSKLYFFDEVKCIWHEWAQKTDEYQQ